MNAREPLFCESLKCVIRITYSRVEPFRRIHDRKVWAISAPSFILKGCLTLGGRPVDPVLEFNKSSNEKTKSQS